ncbi:MAG: coniferyl aldehyde dehydrogenase [Pseudomonadota bacterium]|nr:coniferyl aldehyde dehydrogenase [Pseudomonadota bacterium]
MAPGAEAVVRGPFERLRAAWRAQGAPPDVTARLVSLEKMQAWIVAHQEDIARAISDDFGHRSRHETIAAELALAATDLQHTRAHLRAWARPEARSTFWGFLPGSSRLIRQPLGVVGIVVPWNYPFQLAVMPLAAAVAAGNRVLIKPSELTPRTGEQVLAMVRAVFTPEQVDVVTGGADVGAAFASLPFDHLFFTGSTSVGRAVMRAAAENLTPVTLELGGKSPVVVHASYDAARAAESVAAGKLLNAGQTCIAPDYVLVAPDKVDAFVAGYERAVAQMYPRIVDNPDYTSIISDRHHARLDALLADAVKKGATIRQINPAKESVGGSRKFFPTLVLGATPDMAVMQDEIFGPILPVLPVADVDAAIHFVNDHPRPLALYYFDDDSARAEDVLTRTTSGGASVNATLYHMAQHDMPFGGVGASGMGRYHGFDGFRTFSHEKSVFYQTRLNGTATLRPPYGKMFDTLMKLFVR